MKTPRGILMEKTKRYGILLLFALLIPAPVLAADLAPGHPQEYVVQRGDTLWDISARFLTEPWLWPEIWDRNPQIPNPHLIYPGDIISLVYVDGKPRLRVTRGGERGVPPPGRGVVKYSPQVRAIETEGAIPAIPTDAIQQFLNQSRVVSRREIEAAPYIMSLGAEHIMGGARQKAYARALPEDPPRRFGVYRRGKVYSKPPPWITPTTIFKGGPVGGARFSGEILGYEALYVGDAVLERTGDPATFLLARTTREVRPGDRLLPVEDRLFDAAFTPRGYDGTRQGKIIDVVDGVTQIGQYQIVAIDLGTEDGIETGEVFAVFQSGVVVADYVAAKQEEVVRRESMLEVDKEGFPQVDFEPAGGQRDPMGFADFSVRGGEKVTLPDERAGVVMVFRPFERVSYALVMYATRDIHVYDAVGKP
jgi:hypothetical protein